MDEREMILEAFDDLLSAQAALLESVKAENLMVIESAIREHQAAVVSENSEELLQEDGKGVIQSLIRMVDEFIQKVKAIITRVMDRFSSIQSAVKEKVGDASAIAGKKKLDGISLEMFAYPGKTLSLANGSPSSKDRAEILTKFRGGKVDINASNCVRMMEHYFEVGNEVEKYRSMIQKASSTISNYKSELSGIDPRDTAKIQTIKRAISDSRENIWALTIHIQGCNEAFACASRIAVAILKAPRKK